MRIPYLVLVAFVATGSTAYADAADSDITAPIQEFIAGFNKGDTAAVAKTHAATAGLTIIDEVPPFIWQGQSAVADWRAALDSESKKAGLADLSLQIGTASRVESTGDVAYVIVPATLRFKQQDTPMIGEAQMTFILNKGADGWLIHSWTWTSPRPRPVAPAP